MTCAQRRLRSAWAYAQSDQSLCSALNGYVRIQCFFMRTAKTDQTGQNTRLIRVFAGRIYHHVLLMECHFAAINFRISFFLPLDIMHISNFCGNSFSGKFLPQDYCRSKSLAKLNRFTVHNIQTRKAVRQRPEPRATC